MQTGNPMTLQITLNDHLVETAGKPADSKDVSCFPVFGISKKSNSLEALFQAAHSELQTISNSESIQPVINVPAELLLASSTIEIIHLPSTAVHKTSNFSSSRPILAKFGSSIEPIPQPLQPKDVATLLPIAPVPSHERMNAVVSKPKLPGKYTCSYCFRHCAKPSVLQKHLRAHTGERPYPCNKCGLNFKTKSNLYKHCKTRSHLLQVQSADGSTEQVEVDSSDVSEAVKVEASSAVVEMNRYGAAEEVVSRETEADINESCTDVAQLLIQKQQQQQQQDQQLRQQLQNSPAAVPCHMLELPQNCTLLQLPDGVVYIMEKLENGQAILRPLHEQLAISQLPVAVNQQQMAVSQQDSVLVPQQLSFGQPQSMYGQPPSPVRQPQLAVGQSQQAVGQSQHAVVQSQIAVGQSQLAVGQSQHAVGQSQIAVGQSQKAAGQSQLAIGQSQLPVVQSQLTSSQHELALNEKQPMLNYTDAISSTSPVASKLIPRTAFMSKGLTVPNSEFHSTGTEFGPHTKVLTKSLSANSANACYSLGPAIFPMTRSPSLTNCQGITPKLAPIDPKTMTSKAVQDRIAMLISQNASIIDTPMADAPRPKRIVRQSSEVNVGNSIDGANVPSSKTMVRAKSLTPAEAASLDSMVSHARSDGMRKAASVNFEMQPNDGASRACTNFLSVPPDPNLFGKLPEKRLEPVEPAPRLVRLGLPSQSSSGGGDISMSAPSQQIIQFSSPTNTTTRSQSVGDCFHFQLSSSSPHSMNLISSSRHMSADGFKIGTREPLAKDASNKRRDFAKPRSSNSSNVTIDSDDLEIACDVMSNHNYPSVTVDKEISKEIVPSNSPEHNILPSNSLMPVRIEIVDPLVAPRRGRPKGSKNRSKLSSATSSTTDFDNSLKITSPSTIPQICVTPAESDVPTTESLWKRKLIGRIMSKRSLSMERSASEEISDPLSTPSIISASNSLLQTLMSSKVANSCSETGLQRSQSYDAAMPLKKRRKTLTELGRGTAFGTRIEEAGGASSPQRDSSGSRSEKLKSPSDLRSRSPESDVENLARMRENQIDVRKSESCRSPELTCLVNARGTFPIALKLKSDSMRQGLGKYLSTSVSQEDRFAEADVPPILDIGCETINNIPAGNNMVDSRTRKLRYYEVSKQGMVRAISELTLFDKDDSPEKPRNFLRSNSDSKNDVFEEEVVASIGIENSALSASLVMSLPTGRSSDVAITQRPVIIMQGDDKMPSIIQDHETTSSSDKKEVQTDLNLDRPSRSKSDLLFTAACVSEPKTGVLTHSSYWNYKIGRDREHKTVLDTSDAVEHVSKSDLVERKKMVTEQHKYVGTFDALKEKLSLHEKNVIRRENRIQIFPGGYKSTEEYVYIRGRGKGRYVCGKCGIRCKKPSMLRKHLRTHTDSRPHRCEVCDFGFKTKGNLSKHVKSKSHHARSSSLGSIPGSHRAPMLHKDDRLCVSEQTLAVPDMEMSDCDNADLNSEKDDEEEEEEDDDVSLELKIEKEEEIEDSTSLIIGEIVPVALHRTELSTVQDKFRRARSDSEAAASLLDLSKGDTDVLTEDGASIHQTTVAASSAFSRNIGVVETKRISDVLEARTLSSKRSLSASNIRSLESTVGDPVTKSVICSEQPLVSGATTQCKLPISNNNEVKNPCFVKSDVPSSMFNLSPSTLLPQNFEARSSQLLSVYMLNRPLNKLDMIKTGSTENSSPRPSSGFQPQSSSGFQPLSSSGFQPQSFSGFQPLSSSGFQPLSSSGFQPLSSSGFQPQSFSGFQPLSSSGFQPQSSSGFQPLSSSGFQPLSSSGFQPQSSSGFQPQSSSGFQPLSSSGFQPQSSSGFQPQSSSGFQPLSSSGFQPQSFSGFQPLSSSGFQPQSSSGFQPLSSSGFQPLSSSGFQPQSSSGFQPQSTSGSQSSSGSQKSQSSKLIRIPCEIIPVPGRVVESEEGCVNGKYICPVCQKSFGHQHQLTLHRNIHYLERPHKCQDCDMSFQNRTLLDRHERSVRHQSKSDDPRPYKCDDCSVAFRIHGHLAKHMRSKAHVSKLENVGKTTTDVSTDSNEIDENETSLDGGIEDQNNLKSPETIPKIHCPSPVESSPSDRRLRIDLSPVCQKFAEDAEIKCSNKDIPGQERIISSGSDDAPQQDVFHHKCNICEKTFADIQLFQRHVNSHAELRPFICEQCDAGFTSSHMLTRHLETHKQVRDCCHDICDHCGFTLKENQLDKNAATQSGSADLNPSSEDINSVTVLTSPVNKCDCKRTCDKDVSLDTSRLPAFIQSSMFANSGSLLPMRNASIILSCSAVPLSLAGSTGLALLLPNPSNSFSNDSAALLATESGTSVLLPTSSLSLPLSLSSALHSVLVSSAGLISRQSFVSPGVLNEEHAVTISDIENRSTSSKQ